VNGFLPAAAVAPSPISVPEWSGQWVADHLGIVIETETALAGLTLPDLVGMALRHNPKRAHLLVSRVLGKHIPTDPRLVYAVGRLLGALVVDRILGSMSVPVQAGTVVHDALSGRPTAAPELFAACRALRGVPVELASQITVLGYAETATALGHTVAEQIGADYLHSTRRAVTGLEPVGAFREEHSHATEHLLLPEDPSLLARSGPLVLVDDELSTGRTALNTVLALQRHCHRERYVIAALVDLRSAADRDRMAAVASQLETRIDVVSLAAGHLITPIDILERGSRLVAAIEVKSLDSVGRRSPNSDGDVDAPDDLVECDGAWPPGVREGGRHGFNSTEAAEARAAAVGVAERIAQRLTSNRILVLGFEELMYAPVLIATELADRLGPSGAQVRFSTTTRSPVLAVDDPGYAIRNRLVFSSHEDSAQPSGPRFAYNIAGLDSGRFGDIVLVVDDVGDSATLHAPDELLAQLRSACDRVQLVRIPSYRPGVTQSGTRRWAL
jgi:adenine/guanine phosphoribosyltransferase-like PRPP-binding protein